MNQAVKIIETTDDELIIELPIFLYGGADLVGDTFTPDTDPTSVYTQKNAVFVDWEHGQQPDKDKNGKMKQPGRDDILGAVDWVTSRTDDIGRWARAALNRQLDYVTKFIEPMARVGMIGGSSEAIPSGVIKTADGVMVKWPVKRMSLTVTPMEPRYLTEQQITVIKSLTPDYPALKSLIPIGGQETATESSDKGDNETLSTHKSLTGETNIMSDETKEDAVTQSAFDELKGLVVDIATSVKELATVKAQPDTPEPKVAGVIVTEDEDDKKLKANPFKTLGEFLVTLARNPNDERVRASKSSVVGAGFHDVGKAVGPDVVGSLYDAKKAHKAPTGLGELIPSAGGFLVGTDSQTNIVGRMYDVGALVQRADMIPISSNSNGLTLNAEDESSRATGSRRGGIRAYWAAEASAKTASQPKFREMQLKLQKVIGLVYATDELLQDAGALEAWIMSNLPEELTFTVENAMVRGTGAGQPQGILNSAGTVSVPKETGQAATTLSATNIIDMWSRRWAGGNAQYIWMINQDVTPQLHKLNLPVGTGGALVYMPPGGLSASPFGSLYGAPVMESEYCSTLGTVGDIILARWSEYQMIDKGGVQSASSIHVRFTNDETVFRFVYRVDGQPKWDLPLTPFQGTATQSPFVTVATRS